MGEMHEAQMSPSRLNRKKKVLNIIIKKKKRTKEVFL